MPAPTESRNNLIWSMRDQGPTCPRSHLFQVYSNSPNQRCLHPVWPVLGDFPKPLGRHSSVLIPCVPPVPGYKYFFQSRDPAKWDCGDWLYPSTALCLFQCHTLPWAPAPHFWQSWGPGLEDEEKTLPTQVMGLFKGHCSAAYLSLPCKAYLPGNPNAWAFYSETVEVQQPLCSLHSISCYSPHNDIV